MLDVQGYLLRIAYSGPLTPSPETLRTLHRAHLLSVPFENLDIGWKREIRLNQDSFLEKIIEQRRGGFCYELNGAFAALLQALGFRVTLLSARVPRADGSEGPEFDHLALRVDLEQSWIADVGFGDSFIDPLQLQIGMEQQQYGRAYRIVEQGPGLRLEKKEAAWETEYVFSLKPRALQDFAEMCRYHQTSAESPFTRKRVCSRLTDEGRVTLSDNRLICTTRNGVRQETVVASEEEWSAVLKDRFNVRQP